MRALTLWQPYATLVAAGLKRVETRSWGTDYRGLLAIHAARKADEDVMEDVRQVQEHLREVRGPGLLRPECRAAGEIPLGKTLGCVVAVARLADCRPMLSAPDRQEEMFGTFGPGRWGWVLEDVVPLADPIPAKGNRCLWLPASDLTARLLDLYHAASCVRPAETGATVDFDSRPASGAGCPSEDGRNGYQGGRGAAARPGRRRHGAGGGQAGGRQ